MPEPRTPEEIAQMVRSMIVRDGTVGTFNLSGEDPLSLAYAASKLGAEMALSSAAAAAGALPQD